MSETSFFPFFEVIKGSGIIRPWHQQSLQSKTGHSWVQATNSNPRRKAQQPQFAQFRLKLVFRLKLGGMRQRKTLKDLAPKKNKKLLDKPGSGWSCADRNNTALLWSSQVLSCRHEAWDISFQLRFLFIVWQRFFCDWWNPCVSAMCHCKSAGVKYSQMIVRSRSWIYSFIYFFICLYTNSSTLLFNRGTMLHLDYFGC